MTARPRIPPGFNADLPEKLAARGYSPEAVEALLSFDAAMFAWHRRAARGEITGKLLEGLAVDLDLTQFQAMTAISRIQHGIGRDRAEPATVGLLAEEMAVDPSRASRIASGLIEAGWVRRDVAQDDGRKAVLVLDARAKEIFPRLREMKWERLAKVFEDWSEEEILAFSRLFARYSAAMYEAYDGCCAPDQSVSR